MNLLKWLAYLVLVFAFVWFVFFRPFGRKFDSISENNHINLQLDNQNSEIDDAEIDENYAVDAINSDDASTGIKQSDGAAKNRANLPDDKTDIKENYKTTEIPNDAVLANGVNLDKRYLIVVGSFGIKSNADKLLKTLYTNGLNGGIVKIGGLHRVVVASSNNEKAAKQAHKEFTHDHQKPAFVLKQ